MPHSEINNNGSEVDFVMVRINVTQFITVESLDYAEVHNFIFEFIKFSVKIGKQIK